MYIIYGIVHTHLQHSWQSKLLVRTNPVTLPRYYVHVYMYTYMYISLISVDGLIEFKKAPTCTCTYYYSDSASAIQAFFSFTCTLKSGISSTSNPAKRH